MHATPSSSFGSVVRRHHREIGFSVLAVVATVAFRCPGPDPQAEPDAAGGNGAGASGANGGNGTGGSGAHGGTTSSSSGGTGGTLAGGGGSGANGASGGTGGSGGGCTICNAECVFTATDPLNCGECSRVCDGTNVDTPHCNNGVCSSTCVSGFVNVVRPPAPGQDDGCETPGRRVFVTAQPFLPNFGSAVAADALCQNIADANILGGAWMAWTSDGSSPSSRFARSQDPYRLMDGTVVATNYLALTGDLLQHAIDMDEFGGSHPLNEVWTGTEATGIPNSTTSFCQGWTSANGADLTVVGRTDQTGSAWSNVFQQDCGRSDVHLYCFEQ